MAPGSLSDRHHADCPPGQVFYNCRATDSRGWSSASCASFQCLEGSRPLASPTEAVLGRRQETEPSEITLWPPPPEETSSTTGDSTTTMTDSGITHTIPNDEVVTVTRHTLITTGKLPVPTEHPPSLNESTTSESTERELPTPTGTPPTATNMPDGSTSAALSTGAIVGAALGGFAIVIASIVIFFLLRRRRKKARHVSNDSGASNGTVREDFYDDKHFPASSVTPHTTGTQDPGDPFAPFGGRADEPNRPRNGAVEMDGTSSAPVELPTESVHPNGSGDQAASASEDPAVGTVKQTPSKDPRATLNALRNSEGKPAYVNHWDQYRAMTGGG